MARINEIWGAARKPLGIVVSLALLVYLWFQLDFKEFSEAVISVPSLALAVMVVALLVNLSGSVVRLGVLLRDFGFATGWAIVGQTAVLGAIGGLAFMQVVGQTLTRFALLRRAGVPNATTLVISIYEKIVSTGILLLLALFGLVVLFGSIKFDLNAGGILLLQILASLALATGFGAWLGFAPLLRRAMAAIPSQIAIFRVTRVAGITLLMHAAMLVAFVAIGQSVAPSVGLIPLSAASLVVMFAAALPISFGGWGVRELSAVYVYDTLGIGTESALVISVIVGLSSQALLLIAGGVGAATAVRSGRDVTPPEKVDNGGGKPLDMFVPLVWFVPLATAIAVFFQVKVPGVGINVNLADPLVIPGAVLAITMWWRADPTIARWRVQHLEGMLWAATAVIVISFLIGLAEYGLIQWALFNRLIGWFFLLAYGLTGALIVVHAGRKGFTILLRTLVAAAVAIVVVSWSFRMMRAFDLGLALNYAAPARMVGMAGNPNGFAFQMLLALSILLALGDAKSPGWPRLLVGILTGVIFVGLILSGSRTALVALIAVVAVAVYQRAVGLKAVAGAALVGGVLLAGVVLMPGLVPGLTGANSKNALVLLDSREIHRQWSDNPRVRSIRGALTLWRENPIFGAGLGAVIETNIRQTGVPLVAHNSPIWLLAEAGTVGFAIFVYLFYSIWRYAWTAASNERRRQEALTVVLVLTGLVVMFQLHDLIYQRAIWFIVGACLTLPHTYRDNSQIVDRIKRR